MKRAISLIFALTLLAACGQSEPNATGQSQVDARPAGTAAATTAAATTSAPAADAHAGHDAGHTDAPAASASGPAATAAAQTAPVQTPVSSTAAGQPAPGASTQTAPGIMTDPVATAGFIEGRHFYRIASATAPNPVPGQVEVNEFFAYSCIHCFNLEPYLQAWLPNKPAYINFVPVPIANVHGQAFYAATALGKIGEMHEEFFNTIHNERNMLASQAALREFFAEFGVSDADFNSVFESFSVRSQLSRAEELSNRYGVDSTPTIVVAGKYRTGVSDAGSYERLFALIEALAARELQR